MDPVSEFIFKRYYKMVSFVAYDNATCPQTFKHTRRRNLIRKEDRDRDKRNKHWWGPYKPKEEWELPIYVKPDDYCKRWKPKRSTLVCNYCILSPWMDDGDAVPGFYNASLVSSNRILHWPKGDCNKYTVRTKGFCTTE